MGQKYIGDPVHGVCIQMLTYKCSNRHVLKGAKFVSKLWYQIVHGKVGSKKICQQDLDILAFNICDILEDMWCVDQL